GLTFTNSSGVINECIIKNANIAATLSGTSPVRFTNNMFLNNRVGLNIHGSYTESITGNTFTIDNASVVYKDSECQDFFATSFTAVNCSSVSLSGVIAQNDFINSVATTIQDKKYFGIVNLAVTFAKISSNHFSNMYRSVDVIASSSFSIDNNIMEITSLNSNTEYQIRIANKGATPSSNIDVNNNTITYSSSVTGLLAHSAIYVEQSNSSTIRNNSITGFETAIQLIDVSNSNINENIITNSKYFGIYAKMSTGSTADKIDISCNEIKMDLYSPFQSTGIAYFQDVPGNKHVTIRDNCVLETSIALYLSASAPACFFPKIAGNYLYSYKTYGVFNNNFILASLGTGYTPATAGKNSFFNNNNVPPGAATDVGSTTPLICKGNYNIQSITSLVIIPPTNVNALFYSTASCGNQTGTGNNIQLQLGNTEICDDVANLFRIANVDNNGNATLVPGYENMLLSANENYFISAATAMNVLSVNNGITEQTNLYNTVIDQNQLNATEAALFNYDYLISTKQYSQALADLPALAIIGDDAADFITVQQITLGLLINNVPATSMSETNLLTLEAIVSDSSVYASAAMDLLHSATADYDYDFEPVRQVEIPILERKVLDLENQLDVFPNPATDMVTIKYFASQPGDNALRLTDITGRVLMTIKIGDYYNDQQIDISNLNSGVYLFTLYENNTPVAKSKLIKE
ncbi:MAG TPA: T9SS type A sorting domain-containing protein, partial [Bacteroidia bacterium]|nr:T9SS type A sorting domain-containing protein [Bacteroidia bacterium]